MCSRAGPRELAINGRQPQQSQSKQEATQAAGFKVIVTLKNCPQLLWNFTSWREIELRHMNSVSPQHGRGRSRVLALKPTVSAHQHRIRKHEVATKLSNLWVPRLASLTSPHADGLKPTHCFRSRSTATNGARLAHGSAAQRCRGVGEWEYGRQGRIPFLQSS